MVTGEFDDQQDLSPRWRNLRNSDDDGLSHMSLLDHLEELRWRILKVLIAVVVGSIIAFIFRDWLLDILQSPLPASANALTGKTGKKLVVMGLTEGFTAYLLVSIAAGVVLALPVLLYQIWAFVAPGLYKRERRLAGPFILIGLVLFFAGLALGFIVLRYPVEWLVSFSNGSFTTLVTADSYFKFVAIFLLVFGLVFELPLVLTFMAMVGIISRELLIKKRSIAHFGMWIASCFITPGADIYSPIILGVTMSCLYELTIIFIRLFVKDRPDDEGEIETV